MRPTGTGPAALILLAALSCAVGAAAETLDIRPQLHRQQLGDALDLKVRQSMRRSRAAVTGKGSHLIEGDRRETTSRRLFLRGQQRGGIPVERQLGRTTTPSAHRWRRGALRDRERRETTSQRLLFQSQQRRANAIEQQLDRTTSPDAHWVRQGALHRFRIERSSQSQSFRLGR